MMSLFLAALLVSQEQLPEGPGKVPLIKVCGACHAPEAVLGNRNTRRGWTELVDEMIFRGAKPTPRERSEIVNYLVKNFPMGPIKPLHSDNGK